MEFIRNNFEAHVFSFMEEMQLISPTKKGVIAVSGGLDSICLLKILSTYKKLNFEALHINHGTRAENENEENFVRKFCSELNIKCHVEKLSMSLADSNFELKARNARQNIFKSFVDQGYYVYTAHHLDDSFEWTLMQSFKQSSLKSTLGIPVFSNGLCRVFLCVSKLQLKNYAQALKLSWIEDKSNQNTKFERNALRILFNQALAKRYKGYLRHYVNRQNQLAFLLGKHRLLLTSKLELINAGPHAIEMKSSDFRFHKEKIREYIHYFSVKKRGEIEKELEKLIECHRLNKKMKMHGPFSFSGGVKAYLLKDSLFICHESHLNFYKKLDLYLVDNHTQIQGDVFPHLIILKSHQKKNISKLIHPLLPNTIKKLKENKIAYSFLPLSADLLD
jgi:tRNA(Ile)-lysidine synthase